MNISGSPRPLFAARICGLAVLAAAAAAALVGGDATPTARAFQGDMRAARTRYPLIVGTRLDSCALCHVGEQDYRLDPYGRAYERSGSDFAAIEADDSDGDGWSNLEEITALSFPGKADSTPAATAATPPATIDATATPTQATSTPTGAATTETAPPSPTSLETPIPTSTEPAGHWEAWLPAAFRSSGVGGHGGD
jgi:hypothetical protein